MNLISLLFQSLVSVAAVSFIVLGAGAVLTRMLRQPIERVRCIQWTLAALVMALLIRQTSLLPALSLSVLPGQPVAAVTDTPTTPPELLGQNSWEGTWQNEQHSVGVAVPDAVSSGPPASATAQATAAPAQSASLPIAKSWISVASMWVVLQLSVVAIAVLGAIYCVTTLLVGRRQLSRLLRTCKVADPSLLDCWEHNEPASAMGVRVFVSAHESVPLTFGIRRPVIILPERIVASESDGGVTDVADSDRQQAIGYCLSHEFAHICSRDVLTWSMVHCLQPLLWFQPLFWYLRREMRMAQDQLADNFAAGKNEDTTAYAELLVRFARERIRTGGGLALTMADRRSSLYRRIERLLSSRFSTARSARRKVLLGTIACFTLLSGGLGMLRLEQAAAAPSETLVSAPADDEKDPAENEKKTAEKQEKKANKEKSVELSYSGKVVDKETKEPVAGATVVVRRSILLSHERRIVEESEHKTDNDGVYRFVIPPEQTAERGLYIELDVEHPDYAWKKGFGYALSMIRKNEKLGEEPFFSHIELNPAEAITGRIVNADGQPVAEAILQAYSKTAADDFRDYGSFFKTEADADGKFRLQMVKGGPSVFWVVPKDYAPLQIVSGSKRGDWGDITVKEGVAIKGKVMSATGQPVSGVWVNLEDKEARSEVSLPVATYVNRSAETEKDGSFQLRPMLPGKYNIQVENYGSEVTGGKRSWAKREPLEDVFVAQQIEIGPQDADKPFTVQAIPHVEFHAQYLNSKGEPRSGHAVSIFGRMDGQFFHTRCAPDKKGKIFGRLPHGLSEVRMDAITNEHSAVQVRLQEDGPLMSGRRVDLGTAENDITGVQIIRYTAPIVQVKPVDEEGNVIKDCKVSGVYADGKDKTMMPVGGMATNVFFEHQKDGRHRTSQLVPDRKTKFTVSADGYVDASETIELPEGKERELVLVLKKAPAKEETDETKDDDSGVE